MKDTLLIVGNGFDLQCGLKSHYEDFFNWLRKDNARTKDNVWAIHFLENLPKGKSWTCVEASLLNTLQQQTALKDSVNSYIKLNGEDGIIYLEESNASRGVRIRCLGTRGYYTRNICPYWFLDELMKFEHQFAEYLKEQVQASTDYLPRAKKLILQLADGENDYWDGRSLYVLNFNYPDPFANKDITPRDEDEGGRTYSTNVHGTYESDNIIFGVDYTAKNLPSNMHFFTKTHRKMLQTKSDKALFPNVDEIKFYGHSLGEADYSYFHSIFDCYNLYGDKLGDYGYDDPVELQFYFTIYDTTKDCEIKRNATDSVYKLITTYGTTFENPDRGKNLLHKLLLEGRVHIKFLLNIT